jgi:hypothetical protein
VLLCGDLVATEGTDLTEHEKASFEALGAPQVLLGCREAVSNARSQVTSAQRQLDQTPQAHRAAVDMAVRAIVEETKGGRGAESRETVQAGLLVQEWAFCDPAPELVGAAATALRLLPYEPSKDLFTYWQVTRPDEYIRACEAAYLTQQAVIVEVIRVGLTDTEWVFCDLNQDRVMAAAESLGFLSQDAGEDQIDFWWVTRPEEFIRACKAAFALG